MCDRHGQLRDPFVFWCVSNPYRGGIWLAARRILAGHCDSEPCVGHRAADFWRGGREDRRPRGHHRRRRLCAWHGVVGQWYDVN